MSLTCLCVNDDASETRIVVEVYPIETPTCLCSYLERITGFELAYVSKLSHALLQSLIRKQIDPIDVLRLTLNTYQIKVSDPTSRRRHQTKVRGRLT
jgi:hypothetical protein